MMRLAVSNTDLRLWGWKRNLHTASTIKQPVSSLDGVVDSVGTGSIVDLPQSKADLRHLVAIIQRNVRNVDRHGGEGTAVGNSVSLQ